MYDVWHHTGTSFFRIQRRFKLILLSLLTVATLLSFWFSLSVYGYTSSNAVNIFLSLCLQYFFAMATNPLYYEAAVETTYPVAEGTCVRLFYLRFPSSCLVDWVMCTSCSIIDTCTLRFETCVSDGSGILNLTKSNLLRP